jgi:single-strand DNA-binding protein
MFGDVNQVTLLGNITNDLNVRYTPNGRGVLNFGLATNRRYRLPDSEEWKDDVTFHNIVMFGNQVEMFSQRAKKGTRVFVQGRLQTRSWQDKDGKNNYKTEVVVDRIILIDRYEKGPASEQYSGNQEMNSMPNEDMEEKKAKRKGPKDETVIDPDDLPF